MLEFEKRGLYPAVGYNNWLNKNQENLPIADLIPLGILFQSTGELGSEKILLGLEQNVHRDSIIHLTNRRLCCFLVIPIKLNNYILYELHHTYSYWLEKVLLYLF